jgi:site-specific DNA-methyltransferase (adenine-specific)
MMKDIADETIDLTVTSPPYDNLRKYNGNIEQWNFDKFKAIAEELFRVTADGGVVVWICGDATIKGSETGTSYRQALYFMQCGFNLHDTMIWQKTARIPTQDRYYNTFEFMFVFSKGKPKTMNFICDHKNVTAGQKRRKDKCINKGKNEKHDGMWLVSGDYSRRENVWRIHIGKNKETKGHPAPFPEELAKDHIITWSNTGDIVLDPFMGSGTTGKMAVINDRRFVGFEIDQGYFEIAEERIYEAWNRRAGDGNG